MAGTAIVPRTVQNVPLVGTSVVLVLPANPSRQSLYVFNSSANAMAICPPDASPQIAGLGFQLASNTGIQFFGWTAGLNAVAALGAANVITLFEF